MKEFGGKKSSKNRITGLTSFVLDFYLVGLCIFLVFERPQYLSLPVLLSVFTAVQHQEDNYLSTKSPGTKFTELNSKRSETKKIRVYAALTGLNFSVIIYE